MTPLAWFLTFFLWLPHGAIQKEVGHFTTRYDCIEEGKAFSNFPDFVFSKDLLEKQKNLKVTFTCEGEV